MWVEPPVSPLQAPDPRRVGRWTLLGRLGRGGMGVVYLAEVDGQRAALKMIDPALAADPTFRRRFKREVEICSRVAGRQLAPVLEARPDDPLPWLAVRYEAGPTLAYQVAKAGPLERGPLQGLAIALAEALTQLHSTGVIHRDLKPSNVVLTEQTPVVIDFGIAATADATALTATGTVLGSPGWMAPEQIEGRPVGAPADVFAWGATVAFAATGRPPYGTGAATAVAYRVVHGEPDLVGMAEPLSGLVKAAMSRAPDERPTAAALIDAMVGGPGNVPTAISANWSAPTRFGGGPPPIPTIRHPGPRSQRRPLIAAMAAVAVVAGIAVALSNRDDPASDAATSTTLTSIRSTTSSPRATTTTAPLKPGIRAVDFQTFTYAVTCFEATEEVEVRNGVWRQAPNGPVVAGGPDVTYWDVTRDGTDDAVVYIACGYGGSGATGNVMVFSGGGPDVHQVGATLIGIGPMRDDLGFGDIVVWNESYFADDPHCCPSNFVRTSYTFRSGAFTAVDERTLPTGETPFAQDG